jgi:hypothetical protein
MEALKQLVVLLRLLVVQAVAVRVLLVEQV